MLDGSGDPNILAPLIITTFNLMAQKAKKDDTTRQT